MANLHIFSRTQKKDIVDIPKIMRNNDNGGNSGGTNPGGNNGGGGDGHNDGND